LTGILPLLTNNWWITDVTKTLSAYPGFIRLVSENPGDTVTESGLRRGRSPLLHPAYDAEIQWYGA